MDCTMVQLAASAQEREAKDWENSRQECFDCTMRWTQAQNSRGNSQGFVSCILRPEQWGKGKGRVLQLGTSKAMCGKAA